MNDLAIIGIIFALTSIICIVVGELRVRRKNKSEKKILMTMSNKVSKASAVPAIDDLTILRHTSFTALPAKPTPTKEQQPQPKATQQSESMAFGE